MSPRGRRYARLGGARRSSQAGAVAIEKLDLEPGSAADARGHLVGANPTRGQISELRKNPRWWWSWWGDGSGPSAAPAG